MATRAPSFSASPCSSRSTFGSRPDAGALEPALGDEAGECARLLERIEVLALDVLDEGDGDRSLIRDVADDRRDLREPGHLRGAPAPLAGDDLVALRLAPV